MLVVVSHFCERPIDDLHRPLTQLDAQYPGAIDVVVVVNTTTGRLSRGPGCAARCRSFIARTPA